MDYELIRSKRKTLSLSVDSEGRVRVRAPEKMPEEKISEFVLSKKDWLEKHLSGTSEKNSRREETLSTPPKALPYLGQMCPVVRTEPYGFYEGAFHLPSKLSQRELVPYLEGLYKSLAKGRLVKMTRLRAEKMGVRIASVKINSARTRWGSCSGKGAINLSWRLIAADEKCIEYVIVHELCHTKHMDHSPLFWKCVGEEIPDYAERREELKKVQQRLRDYGLD